MATATAMYHTGKNPLRKVTTSSEEVRTAKGLKQRRLHKAFLRYHDSNNWPLLREALRRMGRGDLIGNSKKHLIPAWQPAGTGATPEGKRTKGGNFRTLHTGLPPLPKGAGKASPKRPSATGRQRRRPA
jgi:hypothetical protein